MTTRAFPFDGGTLGRYVTEDDWEQLAQDWQDSGVRGVPSDTSLKIQAGASRDTITLKAGSGKVNGFQYWTNVDIPIATTKNFDPSLTRKDTVTLKLIKGSDFIGPSYNTGTTSAYPSVGASEILLGKWDQAPESTASGSFWGTASDARWFQGQRMRPIINASNKPPVVLGGWLMDMSNNDIYLGQLVTGTPTWVLYTPATAAIDARIGIYDAATIAPREDTKDTAAINARYTRVVTGSPTTITNTGLQDVTGASASVVAGTYTFLIQGEWVLNAASVLGIGFSGPSTTSYRAYGFTTPAGSGAQAAGMSGGAAFGSAHTFNTNTAATGNRSLEFKGSVVFSASGTLQFRAQRSGSTDATMNSGLTMTLVRTA